MPIRGPNNRTMYRPEEAYDAVGQHLYQSQWQLMFVSGQPLPHPDTLARRVEREGDQITVAIGDPHDDQYQSRQKRARRSGRAYSELVDALYWGKTEAWQISETGDWLSVPNERWQPASEMVEMLRSELYATITRNEQGSGTLLIDKASLDEYLWGWVSPQESGTLPPVADREAKRPGLDVAVIKATLQRLAEDGSLPEYSSGWRAKVCRRLLRENLNWYPTAKTRKEPPKIETLRRSLKGDLDYLEKRLRGTRIK